MRLSHLMCSPYDERTSWTTFFPLDQFRINTPYYVHCHLVPFKNIASRKGAKPLSFNFSFASLAALRENLKIHMNKSYPGHAFSRTGLPDSQMLWRILRPCDRIRSLFSFYGAGFKTLQFVQGQERRKFQPQEYIEYFEDWNLSLTSRLGKKCRFAKVSPDSPMHQLKTD